MSIKNSNGETLKRCKCCKCDMLLIHFKINRKGEYQKTCIRCLEKAKIRREKNRGEFKCELCDYKCCSSSTLKRHIKRIHDKIKDIGCELCDFKCSEKGSLKRHIKQVHKKIKDFECKLCDYKCSANCNLKLHIKMVHKKIKDFECELCDYKCSTNGSLKTHIKQVHTKIKDYECKKCDYKCCSSSTLKKHIKICTGSINCSSGELIIMNILKKMNISYEYNTSYKLKSKNYLRWDFIITINDKKAFIEYDGKQHFKPVMFGGCSMEQAKVNLEKSKKRDDLKNEFCKDNGFKLLRIPYYEKENIEKMLMNFIYIK